MKLNKTLNSLLFLIAAFLACCSPQNDKKQNIVDVILNDSSSFFYIDTAAYPKQNKKLPIGIFDSGTGGLTVFDAIVNYDKFDNESRIFRSEGDGQKDFSEECFVYLGDQANMPYGNYSNVNKVDLLKEHIIKDVQFMLGNKYYLSQKDTNYRNDKSPVKAIVIACNTATAYGKEDIENFMITSGLNLKVIGVIDAGVRAALSEIDKNENAVIGVMATAGTVASNGYADAIFKQVKSENYSGDISVVQQAGIGLAGAIDGVTDFINPLAEKPGKNYKGPTDIIAEPKIDLNKIERYNFNWKNNKMLFEGSKDNPSNIQINSVENYIKYHVVSLMEQILSKPNPKPLSAVILGCTHYPFYSYIFAGEFKRLYDYKEKDKYVYRKYMNENIKIVDPSENVAKELFEYLDSEEMFNNVSIDKSEFYISVPNLANSNIVVDASGNFVYDYKYGRTEGMIQEYVKRVPFSRSSMPDDVLLRLEKTIPFTYELIKSFNNNSGKTKPLQSKEKI
jgi:glutamate racemase